MKILVSETRLGSFLGIGPLFLQLVGIGKLRSYIFEDPVQYFPMVPVKLDEFEVGSENNLLYCVDFLGSTILTTNLRTISSENQSVQLNPC